MIREFSLPTSNVTTHANENPTFSIFATASATILFQVGASRIFAQFRDSALVRGSTSVAVETQ